MAYVYADWITQTSTATRLARLRLHIQEVSQLMTPDISADGFSKGSGALQPYLNDLMAQEQRLAAAASQGGISLVRFGRD